MIFPDCRNDDAYNYDFLNNTDKNYIDGFDEAQDSLENLFDNLEIYEEPSCEDDEISDTGDAENTPVILGRNELIKVLSDNRDEILNIIQDYLEMHRDEMITSMIDNMDSIEYNAIRNKVLMENDGRIDQKEYFDSRKFMITGKKVFTRILEED